MEGRPESIRDYSIFYSAIFIIFLFFITYFIRWDCIGHLPTDWDEAYYASVAYTHYRGGVPYRDTTSIKGPTTPYMYELAFHLFGPNFGSIRLMLSFVIFLTAIFIYKILKRISSLWVAVVGALGYVFLCSVPFGHFLSYTAYTEYPFNLFMVISLYCFLVWFEDKKNLYLFLSSFSGGVAYFARQNAAFLLIFLAGFLVYTDWSERRKFDLKPQLKTQLIFAAGFLSFILPHIAYYWKVGALDEFIFSNITFHKYYTGSNLGFVGKWNCLIDTMQQYYLDKATFFGVIIVAAFCFKSEDVPRTKRMALCLISGILLIALLVIFLPGRYYPHYYLMTLPYFAMLFGMSLCKVIRTVNYPGRILILLFALCSFMTHARHWYWEDWPHVSYNIAHYRDILQLPPGERLKPAVKVAEYIRNTTKENDTITVWGEKVAIYLLSQRVSATKEGVPFLWILEGQSISPEINRWVFNGWLGELKQKRPAIIVDSSRGAVEMKYGPWLHQEQPAKITNTTAFKLVIRSRDDLSEFINKYYVLDKVFEDNILVYRRKDFMLPGT